MTGQLEHRMLHAQPRGAREVPEGRLLVTAPAPRPAATRSPRRDARPARTLPGQRQPTSGAADEPEPDRSPGAARASCAALSCGYVPFLYGYWHIAVLRPRERVLLARISSASGGLPDWPNLDRLTGRPRLGQLNGFVAVGDLNLQITAERLDSPAKGPSATLTSPDGACRTVTGPTASVSNACPPTSLPAAPCSVIHTSICER